MCDPPNFVLEGNHDDQRYYGTQGRVTHQRVAALRKSDGVTPVAFLNAVLKC